MIVVALALAGPVERAGVTVDGAWPGVRGGLVVRLDVERMDRFLDLEGLSMEGFSTSVVVCTDADGAWDPCERDEGPRSVLAHFSVPRALESRRLRWSEVDLGRIVPQARKPPAFPEVDAAVVERLAARRPKDFVVTEVGTVESPPRPGQQWVVVRGTFEGAPPATGLGFEVEDARCEGELGRSTCDVLAEVGGFTALLSVGAGEQSLEIEGVAHALHDLEVLESPFELDVEAPDVTPLRAWFNDGLWVDVAVGPGVDPLAIGAADGRTGEALTGSSAVECTDSEVPEATAQPCGDGGFARLRWDGAVETVALGTDVQLGETLEVAPSGPGFRDPEAQLPAPDPEIWERTEAALAEPETDPRTLVALEEGLLDHIRQDVSGRSAALLGDVMERQGEASLAVLAWSVSLVVNPANDGVRDRFRTAVSRPVAWSGGEFTRGALGHVMARRVSEGSEAVWLSQAEHLWTQWTKAVAVSRKNPPPVGGAWTEVVGDLLEEVARQDLGEAAIHRIAWHPSARPTRLRLREVRLQRLVDSWIATD